MRIMKMRIFVFIFIAFISITLPKITDAKIYHYSILEKIENSDLIVLVEYLEEKEGIMGKIKGEKSVRYKVKEVFKGRYNKPTLDISYRTRYKEFIVCEPPLGAIKGETVIFFLDKNLKIFAGGQGKINLNKEIEKEYAGALKEMINIASIKENKGKAKRLISASSSINKQLNLMAKQIIVRSWDQKYKEYGPILIEVLKDKGSNNLLRYAAAQRLGHINPKGAFEALTECLYDEDELVRKSCAESLRYLKDKRAIPILEEFMQKEKSEIAKGAAEISIRELKKLK